MMPRLGLVFVLLCLLVPCPLLAWEGNVVSVEDGDLMTALHDGREEVVRLFGVDTPDEPQEFGKEAREFTTRRVLGKTVTVLPIAEDRHHNTVAIVSVGGTTLNRELVGSGLAWVYSSHCTRPECGAWKIVEFQARESGIGLWSSANPTPPWDFSHSRGKALPVVQDDTTQWPEEEQQEYLGDIISHLYHVPGCPECKRKSCMADFKGKKKAERAGYKPCPVCNP